MIERVRKAIPAGIARKLWIKAGGRCEYENCNQVLWRDSLTQRDMNKAYISHIIAARPKWKRGNKKLSKQKQIAFDNLMLLCDQCHNRIDKAQPDEHPVGRLRKMKKLHEERIEFLTSIKLEKRTHVVMYGARIGEHGVPLTTDEVFVALLPQRYPSNERPIELGMRNSSFEDRTDEFWRVEKKNLENLFQQKMVPLKGNDEVQHFSVFALAPQPLLIRLGTLLSDIYPADVFQRHREPSTWNWQNESETKEIRVDEPADKTGLPVLKLSLSATITDDRIVVVLGKECSIWTLSIDTPNNDFLKTRALLSDFRRKSRLVFDRIKTAHGENARIHIFPAMPVSAAVELGRVWMPKADLPLVIYDQNRMAGGFKKAINIDNSM